MHVEASHQALDRAGDDCRVVIEMGGPNVVIRATDRVDHAYTTALAEVINAAADTDTAVVIDPEPIRCDHSFVAYTPDVSDPGCADRPRCRPAAVEAVSTGVVRVLAERTVWLIDIRGGRLCQLDSPLDIRFLGDSAWQPIVAVCVAPTRLVALNADGTMTSARRAHATAA